MFRSTKELKGAALGAYTEHLLSPEWTKVRLGHEGKLRPSKKMEPNRPGRNFPAKG